MKTLRIALRPALVALTGAFTLLAVLAVTSQAAPPPPQIIGPGADALARTEADFSRMSEVEGAVKAFGFYLAADVVNPVPSSPTPMTKDGMLAYLRNVDVNGLVLTWYPLRAETASTGDFGFTFGPWEVRKKDSGALVSKGYFVTVWKKGADGAWKAAFDMGNEATLEAK